MKTKLLMLSGGMDSTVIFFDLLAHDDPFKCVFVDYGQKNSQVEELVVSELCSKHCVDLTVIRLPGLFQGSKSTLLRGNIGAHTVENDEVRNRNATLANIVASNIDGSYTILIGAHKTMANYADATPQFYTRLSKLLHWSTNSRVDCEAPYIRLTKKQIVKKAWDLAVSPLEMNRTVSCYEGSNCGYCPACVARRNALRGSNYDPL